MRKFVNSESLVQSIQCYWLDGLQPHRDLETRRGRSTISSERSLKAIDTRSDEGGVRFDDNVRKAGEGVRHTVVIRLGNSARIEKAARVVQLHHRHGQMLLAQRRPCRGHLRGDCSAG